MAATARAGGTIGVTFIDQQYKAALRKLEYEEKTGRLISAEEVKRDASRVGMIVKERVSAWPGRTAPLVAPISDIFEVEQILKREGDQLLTEISKEFERAANESL